MDLRATLIATTVQLVQRISPTTVRVNGIQYETTTSVFNPKFFITSKFLADNMEIESTDEVLDMGSGCGIQSITAALRARHVVATDLNPEAVECTWRNAKRAKVQHKITVLCGDLFSSIPSHSQFDTILFNPPYLHGQARSLLGHALFDPNKSIVTRFLAGASSYLKPGGSIQMCYSTAAHPEHFVRIAAKQGWEWTITARRNMWVELFLLYKLQRFALA